MTFDSFIHNIEHKIESAGKELSAALHGSAAPEANAKPAQPANPQAANHELQESGLLPHLSLTGLEHAAAHIAEEAGRVGMALIKGAANEVVHHPGKIVGEVAVGAAVGVGMAIAVVAAPEVAAVAGTAMAAAAIATAGVELYEHGRQWYHAAHVVADPEHFSKAEQSKAESTVESLGAGATNMLAFGLGAAAGAPFAGVVVESSIEIAESRGISNWLSEYPRSMKMNARRIERLGIDTTQRTEWPGNIADAEAPPVAPGMARLYRGIKPIGFDTEFNPIASEQDLQRWDRLLLGEEKKWTPSDYQFFKQAKESRIWQNARFYTDDMGVAKHFAGPDGKLLYVDLPFREAFNFSKPAGMLMGPDGPTIPSVFALPEDLYLQAREHVESPTNPTTTGG